MKNLPALPFVITTVILLFLVIYLLATRKRNTLTEEIRLLAKKFQGIKRTVLEYSADYMDALGLTEQEVDVLKEYKRSFLVNTPSGDIKLIFKDTCGSWDNQVWKVLLQSRSKRQGVETLGGGTGYIEILPPEDHRNVLRAIKEGKFENLKEESAPWP